ncbi:MAG TPA: hypothetical protein VFR65_04135 [Nitrososphaeraceae archaeon]|nr:hypothetical protein [Nitrososphaeraceae archaeon]
METTSSKNSCSLQILQKRIKYGDHLLPSGYFVSQTYGALHKCWVGFVITKKKYEWGMIEIYAKLIKKLERELGIEVTDFSDWGI